MALNDITFNRGQGGLGRPLAGEDHISGLMFYTDVTVPIGFTTPIQTVYSIEGAEALGIVSDRSDETKATVGSVAMSINTAIDDVLTITMQGVTLGTYTALDTVLATAANGLRDSINAGTLQHGYTATSSSVTVTLIAPVGLGASINGGSNLVFASSGLTTAIVTQFAGGVDAFFDIMHYQVKAFFDQNPSGVLYIAIYPATAKDYNKVVSVQDFAEGKIRQMGIFETSVLGTASVTTTLQGACDALEADHKPIQILYAADISAVSDVATTLTDLTTYTNKNVSVVVGQDGNAMGAELAALREYSVCCLGAALGAVSRAKVNESIAWVQKFDMSGAGELGIPAFGNGVVVKDKSLSYQGTLNDKGYIFLRKHTGLAGSFFNDSFTADAETSDYATIENNRTMDKAVRGVRTLLLPHLNSPLYVNDDGSLTEDTIGFFTNEAGRALGQMERDEEVSAFAVTIDPTQNVLATSTLQINIKVVPVGVARQLQVNIGFTVKL